MHDYQRMSALRSAIHAAVEILRGVQDSLDAPTAKKEIARVVSQLRSVLSSEDALTRDRERRRAADLNLIEERGGAKSAAVGHEIVKLTHENGVGVFTDEALRRLIARLSER